MELDMMCLYKSKAFFAGISSKDGVFIEKHGSYFDTMESRKIKGNFCACPKGSSKNKFPEYHAVIVFHFQA
jgi:hypothetical protein